MQKIRELYLKFWLVCASRKKIESWFIINFWREGDGLGDNPVGLDVVGGDVVESEHVVTVVATKHLKLKQLWYSDLYLSEDS